MATIRKRKNKWQVVVRRKGFPPVAKTLIKYSDAKKFANEIENKINKGIFQDFSEAHNLILADILKRYRDEVCPKRKWGQHEVLRINKLLRNKICKYSIARVTPHMIAKLRDELSPNYAASTVNKYLTIISVVYNLARTEWDINCINPVSKIKRMSEPEFSDERLSPETEMILLKHAAHSKAYWLKAMIIVALESGMRRGELMKLKRSDCDLEKRIATLKDTKNGTTRKIGLSIRAITELKRLTPSIDGRFFPTSIEQFKSCWRKLKKQSGLKTRFHLLRHEWASRMFESGWDISAVATQGGWKDWKVLRRYTKLSPEYLASKFKTN